MVLRVGDQVSLDFRLQIGGVTETVNVTETAPLLVMLPLDGRNFVPLIALSPGVMLPPTSTLPRINGSRPRQPIDG